MIFAVADTDQARVRMDEGSDQAERRFYVAAQAALANSGSNFLPPLSNAKHMRASLRPSATKAAVVLHAALPEF